MRTAGSDFDTVPYVRSTCGTPASQVACNDDTVGLGTQSQVEIQVMAGASYYVVLDGFGASAGNYRLQVTQGACRGAPAC